MKERTVSHFGIFVAYVLPGFIVLAGLAPLFPAVAKWLQPVDQGDLGIGPPVYALMAATCLGLILTCFRWVLLDHFHAWTGIRRPTWDDRQLHDVLGGFDYLVQNHFRYYEFFGNAMVAGLFVYALNRMLDRLTFLGPATDVAMIVIVLVLFAASRDALAKYYSRTSRLMGQVAEKDKGLPMFENSSLGFHSWVNGNDHGGSSAKPRPDNKSVEAPKAPAKPRPSDPKKGKNGG